MLSTYWCNDSIHLPPDEAVSSTLLKVSPSALSSCRLSLSDLQTVWRAAVSAERLAWNPQTQTVSQEKRSLETPWLRLHNSGVWIRSAALFNRGTVAAAGLPADPNLSLHLALSSGWQGPSGRAHTHRLTCAFKHLVLSRNMCTTTQRCSPCSHLWTHTHRQKDPHTILNLIYALT